MTHKPVIPREKAIEDTNQAIDRYLVEAGEQVALDFINALECAYRHIAHHPAIGSPRYALELELPGLRVWPLERFPHLVFYVEHHEYVDVWRVLHAGRAKLGR